MEREVERLTRAVAASRRAARRPSRSGCRARSASHAYIFDAHLLMLEDPLLLDRAVAIIREEHVNAEWALRTVSDAAARAVRGV